MLAVVLVLAIVVSAFNGSLSGSAAPIPLRDQPAVGDCLLANTGPKPSVTTQAPGKSGPITTATAATPTATAQSPGLLTSAPCDGARYGEITDVYQSIPSTGTGTVNGTAEDAVDDQGKCDSATAEYLNGAGLGIDAAGSAGVWSPTAEFNTLVVRPSSRQFIAGQRWVACAVVQLNRGGQAVRFSGTLKDVTDSDHLAHLIGTCVSAPDLATAVAVDCSIAHPAEKFATIYSTDQHQSAGELRASCGALIDRLSRGSLTTNSDLNVLVTASGPTDGSAGGLVPNGNAVCGITTKNGRMLHKSLLGIGSGPLPWN